MKYIFLSIFAFLWFTGFSENFARWLSENNVTPNDYRYGDLYRMSNLAQFKAPVEQCEAPQSSPSRNIALVILGDSFTEKERIEKNHFKGLVTYQRFFISDTTQLKLDKSRRNILIIETVERHVRERFALPYKNLQIIDNEAVKEIKISKTVFQIALNYEVPYNTERHEALLFSSDFFLIFKECKAWLNWKIFGRLDKKVLLSKDQKHLLYELDAQPSGINSCFDNVSESEIKTIVQHINITNDFYRKAGFDEVYLSIIPNKTSLVATDLGKYNHLIERIQQDSLLKMHFIDVHNAFKKSDKPLYEIGDSHWNCAGKQIWVDNVNANM